MKRFQEAILGSGPGKSFHSIYTKFLQNVFFFDTAVPVATWPYPPLACVLNGARPSDRLGAWSGIHSASIKRCAINFPVRERILRLSG